MSKKYSLIKAPQLGTNENSATLVDWSVKNKVKVDVGDIICTLETTKSTFEVESNFSGYFLKLIEVGKEISVGDPLAVIASTLEILEKEKNKLIKKSDNDSNKNKKPFKATIKAEKLAEDLKIDLSNLDISGIIKENHVKEFAEEQGLLSKKDSFSVDTEIAKKITLIGNRKTAKDLMVYSKRNIPHSYIEKSIKIDNWLSKIESYVENVGKFITVLSLVICALGRALKKYENFNSYREKNEILLYKKINVGVVVSLDENLSLPVLKNVDQLNPQEITQELMRIRKDMLKKKSNPDDFTGSTITVSAMDHTDVIRFVPIIHPNQSAIISVPKIEKRIDLDNNDKIIKYNTINLGISFDHSFLDANQANNFFIELENQINMIVNNI